MRAVGWLIALGVVAFGVLARASAADAAPPVAVDAPGDCPSAEAIRAALPPGVTTATLDQPGAMILEVRGVDGGVHVAIRIDGQVNETTLQGRDCAALAGAVAALADTWLVELAPVPVPAGVPAPAPAPRTIAPAPARIAPGAAPRWYLGVARALVIDTGAARGAASLLDVTWATGWHRTRVRARVDWGEPMRLDGDGDTTATRTPWGLLLAAGWRTSPRRWWAEALIGGGVVASRIDATAMDVHATAIRMHLAATGGAAIGVEIGLGVSLRVELAAAAYPIADRYLFSPAEVGHSPWASVSGGIGLDVALGAHGH